MSGLFQFILVILASAATAGCRQITIDNTRNMNKLTTQKAAIERAVLLTGLDRVSSQISAQPTTIKDDNTPFLARQFENEDSWCVQFDDVSFTDKLSFAKRGYPDAYSGKRKFSVFIDTKTGKLLKIKTDFKGDVGGMKPEPDVTSAEFQLKCVDESYNGLPSEDPKVTFLDAVNVVLKRGLGSALVAKEINGLYVMDSRMKSAPRPVWVITVRGLPPLPVRGPRPMGNEPEGDPQSRRNHSTIRNVVDAVTGEWLFATSFSEK